MALRFTNTIYVGKALPSSSGGGGQSYSAGDGISISANTISAHTDGTTIGFDSNGALSCSISAPSYSAGNGIVLSEGIVSAKVDSSTIGFDSNGALSCTVSGGGQTYTAGDGIVISGGQIAATSTLLNDVSQRISGSGYLVATQDTPGEYIYFNGSGMTLGASGVWRTSVGASAAAIRCATSTGVYLSGNTAQILTNGATKFNASGYNAYLYGGTTAGGIRVYASGSTGYAQVKSNNGSYEDIITESSYATASKPGIVQPDNSTCTVASGGILSMAPPTTLWTSGNVGSEITYSALDGANVIRVYKNGLLMESGADYVIGLSGIVSYTTPLESSDKAAFEYYPAAPTRNIVPDGGKKSSASDDKETDDDGYDDREER